MQDGAIIGADKLRKKRMQMIFKIWKFAFYRGKNNLEIDLGRLRCKR